MVQFKWISTALTLALLALPASALAGGGAAGDQYAEQVPSATGDNDPGGGSGDISASGTSAENPSGGSAGTNSGSVGGSTGPIGSTTTGKFDKGGADGKAALNLADQTAPNSAALNDAAAKSQGESSVSSGNVFDSPGDSSSSDDGIGVGLPIILGIVLIGGVAFAIWRRRGDQRNGRRLASEGLSR